MSTSIKRTIEKTDLLFKTLLCDNSEELELNVVA